MNLWKTKLFTYNISANTFHTNLKVRFFQETFATDQFLVASSRRWVSQGTVQKTAREKLKKTLEAIMKDQVDQLNTIGVGATAMRIH